jgi:hypothetical protein
MDPGIPFGPASEASRGPVSETKLVSSISPPDADSWTPPVRPGQRLPPPAVTPAQTPPARFPPPPLIPFTACLIRRPDHAYKKVSTSSPLSPFSLSRLRRQAIDILRRSPADPRPFIVIFGNVMSPRAPSLGPFFFPRPSAPHHAFPLVNIAANQRSRP